LLVRQDDHFKVGTTTWSQETWVEFVTLLGLTLNTCTAPLEHKVTYLVSQTGIKTRNWPAIHSSSYMVSFVIITDCLDARWASLRFRNPRSRAVGLVGTSGGKCSGQHAACRLKASNHLFFQEFRNKFKEFSIFHIKDIGTDNLGLFGWSYFLNFLFFANLDFNFSSILLNNTNMNWGLSFTDSKTRLWSFQAHTAHNSWFPSWTSQPSCQPVWDPWLCRRNISILQLDKTIFMVIFAFRYNVKISCPLKNPSLSILPMIIFK